MGIITVRSVTCLILVAVRERLSIGKKWRRYIAIALLLYSCGQPAFGDNKSYSTEDIRMKWYGCYNNASKSSGSPPVAAAVWCDCIIDRLRSEISSEEYMLRELQGDPKLKDQLVEYVLECSPFKTSETIDIKESI